MRARTRFEGRCVKTMVFRRPIRAPSQPATIEDPAWSSPTPKKTSPMSSGPAPNWRPNQNTMKLWTMKPPANASTEKSAASLRTMLRDRCRPRAARREALYLDGVAQARGEEGAGDGADGDDEQPALVGRERRQYGAQGRRTARREGAHRTGEVGDCVVAPVHAAALLRRCRGEHRLLDGRDRARLVRIGRDRAGQAGEHEQRDSPGEGEDRPGDRGQRQEDEVRAPPPQHLAPSTYRERRDRHPEQDRREHDAHLGRVQATRRQGRADEDAAEAVDERPNRLDREDEPDVRHPPGSAQASSNHARMRRVTVRSPVATSVPASADSAMAVIIRIFGIGGPP